MYGGASDDHDLLQRLADSQGTPTFAIRPRIFLEDNFFVDVSPGTPDTA